MPQEIGRRIKALREQMGLSQNRLAKLAGISQAGLSAIENTTKSPSAATLERIATALGVSISFLYEDDPASPSLDEQLSGISFALYGEIHDLTDDEKQDILDYVRFKRSQKKR